MAHTTNKDLNAETRQHGAGHLNILMKMRYARIFFGKSQTIMYIQFDVIFFRGHVMLSFLM